MSKILLILALLASVVTAENKFDAYYQELSKLDKKQMKVLTKAYQHGKKHDLEETLASIAWKESLFNTSCQNLSDGKRGSYSAFQILLDTAIVRNNVKTKKGVKLLKNKLLTDFNFSANEAIAELSYWRGRYGDTKKAYSKMIASYNAGSKSLKNKAGKEYAEDIVLRTKVLKKYLSNNKILPTKS